MHLFGLDWPAITNVVNWLTLSSSDSRGLNQQPIPGNPATRPNVLHPHYPVFKPPGGRVQGPGSNFTCDYRNMPGWYECSDPENRECWLRHPDGREFNMHTDYEKHAPLGVWRNYTLVVSDGSLNADGLIFPYAKLFNSSFPGPWIQACWGDVSADVNSSSSDIKGSQYSFRGSTFMSSIT